MKLRVYDKELKAYTTVHVAFIVRSDDENPDYRNKIYYDGAGNGESALWVEDHDRFTVCSPWHIHWFKQIGDWTGYVGIKQCRCGERREYDIY